MRRDEKATEMNQNYFDKVYEKTYRTLLRYAIVHLSDPVDAEDALQNVYLGFYRRIEARGHADILAPQAFLLKMLRHEVIRHYAVRAKRSAFEAESLETEAAADPVSFEDAVENREAAGQVLEAAKALSPDSYRVFVLFYGFGLSVSEIAKETQLGEEAVKSRLYRGRNAVRRLLKDQGTPRTGR